MDPFSHCHWNITLFLFLDRNFDLLSVNHVRYPFKTVPVKFTSWPAISSVLTVWYYLLVFFYSKSVCCGFLTLLLIYFLVRLKLQYKVFFPYKFSLEIEKQSEKVLDSLCNLLSTPKHLFGEGACVYHVLFLWWFILFCFVVVWFFVLIRYGFSWFFLWFLFFRGWVCFCCLFLIWFGLVSLYFILYNNIT